MYDRSELRRRSRRRRARRRLVVALTGFVAFCVLVAAAGFAYVEYRNHQIRKLSVSGLAVDPPSGVENILLVGSNSRCALNGKQAAQFGSCAQVGGARSDVTMLLHLDPANHSAFILSIPRDLFVPIPGTTAANRVDAALNAGPTRLVHTIEDDLGIPINHFVELNFDTFQGVVNALGGVSMYFPDPVKDAYSGLNVTTPGCHHLNGTEALQVVRARHMFYMQNGTWYYDPMGDLSRIKRDHEFLRVLAAQVAQRGLSNPLTANAILGSVAPDLQVDSGFSLSKMLGLALAFHGVNPNSVPTYTLPVSIDPNPFYYRGADYGDVVLPSQPQDQQVIDRFLGVSSPPGSSVSPSSFSVAVENGTGGYNQAADTASALKQLGFNITSVGNASIVGPVSETTVYYAPGHLADAERVAGSLTGTVVIGQGPTSAGSTVTVVTGSNFSVTAPSGSAQASSTTGTAQASSSGSSSSGSGSSGSSSSTSVSIATTSPQVIAPPTVSHAPLPSYDPRSCSPSGGPGS